MLIVTVLIAWLFLSSGALSQTQTATPPTVGPFGAIPGKEPDLDVSSQLRALLPRGAKVRVAEETKLTPQGETFLLYELGTGEPLSEQSGVLFVRDGKIVQQFRLDEGCWFSTYAVFPLSMERQGAATVFRCGVDGAAAQFVFFAASGKGIIHKALDLMTTEGRIRIHEGNPPLLETWSSARWDLDGADIQHTCVWCEHHYRIRTYEWHNGQFLPRQDTEITKGTFDPGEFLQRPLEVVPQGQN